MIKDRRHYIRWQLNKTIGIRLKGGVGEIPCLLHDLNFSGAKVTLTHNLPRKRHIEMKLILSRDSVLELKVWVAWQKKLMATNVYGLCFSQISQQDKVKIYRFIYRCFPEEAAKRWGREQGVDKGGEIMEDRRIFARFPARFALRFIDSSNNQEGQAEAIDASAKGIGLVTETELSPQSPLEMWLNIPDRREPLYTRGEVTWSSKLADNRYKAGINLERADFMGMSRLLRV